jgi:signal transduction histidine kinase
MNESSMAEPADKTAKALSINGKKFVLMTVAIAAIVFIVALVWRSLDQNLSSVSDFLAYHIILDVFSVAVCFAIFGLRISAHRFTKEFQSLYIGAAFFAVGFFLLFHILTYEGMPDFSGQGSMNRASYYWIFALITFPAIILAATTFPRKDYNRIQLWSLLIWLPFSLGVVAVDVAHMEALPVFYDNAQQATMLYYGFEAGIIALFALAIFSVWRWDRHIREKGSAYMISALALGILGELALIIYPGAYDAFGLFGHMLGFVSFVLIFLALFRGSVEIPYQTLDDAKKVVEKTNVELGTEKMRSDRYFDFLAHDIANILAPIMSYGVMISSHPNAPGDIRRYSRKIVDQTDKAAKFITNMRRLTEAEKTPLDGSAAYNLTANMKSIEERFRREHAKKRMSFTVKMPENREVLVNGGEYVEDILFAVLGNAAKHTKMEEARIKLEVIPDTTPDGYLLWRITVEDEGQGIPDQQKASIANPFDATQRFSRGVGSTISFMSAIAKHFGGNLMILDRIPGDHTKGTRVIVHLPAPMFGQKN